MEMGEVAGIRAVLGVKLTGLSGGIKTGGLRAQEASAVHRYQMNPAAEPGSGQEALQHPPGLWLRWENP